MNSVTTRENHPIPTMMQQRTIPRRTFLKETLAGTALLSLSSVLPTEILLAEELSQVPKDLVFFSPKEYLVFDAVAERIIGQPSPGQPRAREIGVASRADQFLAGADPEVQDQLHQLLTVFNSPIVAALFEFRFSSFLDMSAADRDSYILGWMTSMFGVRRTGFQALKRISLSMFYTDSRSWKEIGYEGMFMPEDRR